MRIAVVSDMHGNWTALQAVPNDLKSIGPVRSCGRSIKVITGSGSPSSKVYIVEYLRSQSRTTELCA